MRKLIFVLAMLWGLACKAQTVPFIQKQTITEMKAYTGTYIQCLVRDRDSGGVFYYTDSALTVDDINIFLSAKGGVWVKTANNFSGSIVTIDTAFDLTGRELTLQIPHNMTIVPSIVMVTVDEDAGAGFSWSWDDINVYIMYPVASLAGFYNYTITILR